MVLGQSRATRVRDALVKQGISGDRIKLISMGKEKPFCTTAESESCWSQNRRAHFVLQDKQQASIN
jgi:peptidoglycan-associated lipoprotein